MAVAAVRASTNRMLAVGLAGGDAMPAVLEALAPLLPQMLAAARVTPEDEVVDLGAGDGKIPIAAARQFGARAWGIEYNKDLAALAQRWQGLDLL